MLIDQKAAGPNKDPNLKPRIFVLSDGETNTGHSLDDDSKKSCRTLEYLYTQLAIMRISRHLQEISRINEAACINADTDDVVYELGNLFNAEM